MKVTDIIKFFLLVSVLVLVSFLIGQKRGSKRAIKGEGEKLDTLYIRDTIVQYEPILEERIVLQKELIPVRDTLWKTDTLYMMVEREQVVWQDSLSKVYASGILPQIDSVYHYTRERVVTRTEYVSVKEIRRWGLGLHAGYGIGLANGGIVAQPYIGIGVSYNFLNW